MAKYGPPTYNLKLIDMFGKRIKVGAPVIYTRYRTINMYLGIILGVSNSGIIKVYAAQCWNNSYIKYGEFELCIISESDFAERYNKINNFIPEHMLEFLNECNPKLYAAVKAKRGGS